MAYFVPQPWVAAANPDIQDLRRLINNAMTGSGNESGRHDINQETDIRRLEKPAVTEYGEWVSTPLLRAIKHNHVEHVRAMLDAGVEPNGITTRDMLRFAVGISADDDDVSKEVLEEMDQREMINQLQSSQKQENPMIDREISRRTDGGNARPFWGHPGPQDELPYGEDDILPERDVGIYGNIPMTSLTVAAWCGRPQIIDLLLAHGADTTSWVRGDNKDVSHQTIDIEPTCSDLSLIPPLHAAIRGGHPETVKHLLKRGFNPNTTRRLALDGATSALQYSIITRWKTGPSAFEILAEDARADFCLQTPYLRVSILHLAVATLDKHLVEQVMTHSSTSMNLSTKVTALGQTVLHISCMPATDADLKFYNTPTGPAVQESIHHCRGITPTTSRDGCVVDSQAQHRLQSDMVDFLLERHRGSNLAELLLVQQDVFGNTPLHYLAAAQRPNVELLARLVRGDDDGEVLDAWNCSVNEKGYSPRDLYGTDVE